MQLLRCRFQIGRSTRLLAASIALLVAGSAGASVQSELSFHRGVAAYGEERYADARAHFEKVLAEDPEDVTALHYLGLVSQADGDLPGAIEIYQRALALDPDDPDLRFDLGTAQLEDGQLEEARQSFEAVVAAQPDHARAHLFLGIAAYRAGDFAEALPQLDRAEELDSALRSHARYYAGLSAVYLGDVGAAETALAQAQEQSPLSPLGQSARDLREQLQPQDAERRWALAVTSGMEWDTNPFFAGETAPRSDDWRGVWRVSGSVRLIDSGRYTVVGGYDGFFSLHTTKDDVDLQTHVGWASASFDHDPIRLGIRYDYAYTWIDRDDEFRRAHRLTPTVTRRWGSSGISQVYFQWQHLDFFQDTAFAPAGVPIAGPGPFDRDGNQYSVGLNHFLFPDTDRPLQYIRLGVLGDFMDTEGAEYRYDGYEFLAGVGFSLPFDVDLTALYRYTRRDYSDVSVFTMAPFPGPFKKRDDSIHRVDGELVRAFGDHWEASVAAGFTSVDSDVPQYDYTRTVVGMYGTYRF